MNKQYQHLNRHAFHAGLIALREQLQACTERQIRAKSVLGVSGHNVSWKEYAEIRDGKMRITALLNVYLNVRGKDSAHKVDKFPSAAYLKLRDDAQAIFDENVEAARSVEAVLEG